MKAPLQHLPPCSKRAAPTCLGNADLHPNDGGPKGTHHEAVISNGSFWRAALAAPLGRLPVRCHGNAQPGNLLLDDGRLSAVFDCGSGCAMGKALIALVSVLESGDQEDAATTRA